jgi:HAD superfamily hydrolase (TIGR01484 family)
MTSIRYISKESLQKVRFVLTDIDGTLTDSGKFTAEAYTSLWELSQAGYKIIPITGGGAGTAIYAIQAWPIDAIITESGALAYFLQNGVVCEYIHPEAAKNKKNASRESMIQEFEDKIPGFRLAKDQFARIYDTAVDYHESKPWYTEEQINKVYRIAEKYRAHVRRSSIHLNVFFGEYDKLETVQNLLHDVYKLDNDRICSSCIYVGDAPNDEEMFEFFPLSVGVNNVLDYKEQLKNKPKYLTEGRSGEGFTELADLLLNSRI